MSKTITDLRESLFDALDLLKTGKITVQDAKAIADLGQVLVNTAKIEADYVARTGARDSGFIVHNGKPAISGLISEETKDLPDGVVRRTVHKLL